MQFDHLRVLAAAASLAAAAGASWGHIEYFDLNQGRQIRDLTDAGKAVAGNDIPLSNPSYWTSSYQTGMTSGETWTSLGGSFASGTWGYSVRIINLDSASWTDGLRNNPAGGSFLLGDTHKVNFANFHLARESRVTIGLQDDYVGSGYGLNPSFSLYRGLAVYQAHDEAVADPLNPRATLAPFEKIQSSKDSGTIVDSQGITSAYRNTLTNSGSYFGQFNAQGGWSVANLAGDWSAVEFVTAVTGYVNPDGSWIGNANQNSLVDYLLQAGDYIIAFGGNAQPVSYASGRSGSAVTNLPSTLSFEAEAVPEGTRLSRLLRRLGPEVLSTIAAPADDLMSATSHAASAQISAVPEPEAWGLMLAGLAMLVAWRRRSRE